MIEVNLAPSSELEDKYWYVPDVTLAVLVLAVGWVSVSLYLHSIEEKITTLQAETTQIKSNTTKLRPQVLRFKEVKNQLEIAKKKIQSIKKITVSKVSRFLPIIVLEKLQQLKPEGVWFVTLMDDTKLGQLNLSGQAFDNLLVAEFMSLLNDTRRVEYDVYDIRDQVYFSEVRLGKVTTRGASKSEREPSATSSDVQKAFLQTRQIKEADDPKDVEVQTTGFPELSDFPQFYLTIKYSDRQGEDQ